MGSLGICELKIASLDWGSKSGRERDSEGGAGQKSTRPLSSSLDGFQETGSKELKSLELSNLISICNIAHAPE